MRGLILFFLCMSLYANDFFYEFGKKVEIIPVNNTRDLGDIKLYKTKSGKLVKFKNEIIIKLKKETSKESLFSSFNITNYKKLAKNLYLIKPTKDQNLFKLSQKLYESGLVEYAIPNRVKKFIRR